MTMECPRDKYIILCRLLVKWSSAFRLSLRDLEKAAGIMYWLSSGFTIGRGSVGNIIHDRTRAQCHQRRRGGPPRQTLIALSDPCRAAFRIWGNFFPKWDRFCPIIESFTPTSTWQVLGRVDACTTWGCGGWAFVRGGANASAANHEWTQEERTRSFVKDRESTGVMANGSNGSVLYVDIVESILRWTIAQ